MKRRFVINKTFSINNDEDFRNYAHNLMKQAHGDDYSEDKTDEVVNGLLKDNPNSDYGELIGRLTSSFGNEKKAEKEFSDTNYAVYADEDCKQVLHKGTKEDCEDWVDDNIEKLIKAHPNHVIEKVKTNSRTFSSGTDLHKICIEFGKVFKGSLDSIRTYNEGFRMILNPGSIDLLKLSDFINKYKNKLSEFRIDYDRQIIYVS